MWSNTLPLDHRGALRRLKGIRSHVYYVMIRCWKERKLYILRLKDAHWIFLNGELMTNRAYVFILAWSTQTMWTTCLTNVSCRCGVHGAELSVHPDVLIHIFYYQSVTIVWRVSIDCGQPLVNFSKSALSVRKLHHIHFQLMHHVLTSFLIGMNLNKSHLSNQYLLAYLRPTLWNTRWWIDLTIILAVKMNLAKNSRVIVT